ncbi:MAG: MepB family protein [Polaribacter sp.]|nr:MepB family protein [Polaribacter sp.]
MNQIISNYLQNTESQEYKACSYEIDGIKIIERTAKITPKKISQFVTCWKRNANGTTEPFKDFDDFDFFIIKIFDENSAGYFKFSKAALIKNGIISTEKKDGKRGFRVYPIWDKPTSKQAIKTQKWQLEYFIND